MAGLSHHDLVALWGEHRVVRYVANALRDIPIPNSAKDFLAEVGIPWRVWPKFAVKAGAGLADTSDAPAPWIDEALLSSAPQGDGLRIGWDYVGDICVVESGDVWALRPESRGGVYVNSSVDLFVASLFRRSQAMAEITGLTDEELEKPTQIRIDPDDPSATFSEPLPLTMSDEGAEDRFRSLATELRALDPAAFRDPSMWWPADLELDD